MYTHTQHGDTYIYSVLKHISLYSQIFTDITCQFEILGDFYSYDYSNLYSSVHMYFIFKTHTMNNIAQNIFVMEFLGDTNCKSIQSNDSTDIPICTNLSKTPFSRMKS